MKMSVPEDGEAVTAEVNAIGISFGNSNSSIAYTSGVCRNFDLGIQG